MATDSEISAALGRLDDAEKRMMIALDDISRKSGPRPFVLARDALCVEIEEFRLATQV